MHIRYSDEEKKFFDRLQLIRNFFHSSAPSYKNESLEKLIIQNILHNRFSGSGVKPDQSEFDALADDIHYYMQKSLNDFIEFVKDRH